MMSNELPTVALTRLLEGARYEVMPTATIADKVRAHVPLTEPLTVTAAPGKGLGATFAPVSYTHLRAHETALDLACRLLFVKKTK